ncbi:MAG: hypothetical protein ACJ706_04520 [Nitrososphaeraceae archaeon]
MPVPSSKKEHRQKQAKKSYWQNELHSLGIEPNQKKEPNDDEKELENLAHIIKKSIFQDYKVAYSEKGNNHKEEAESTYYCWMIIN